MPFSDIWLQGLSGLDLDPQVHSNLLQVAHEFYANLELSAPMEDILLVGSMAGFNWTEYSDIDVHLVVDFSLVDENIPLVKDYFNARRKIWNDLHDIFIHGHEVEIYVQDLPEENVSEGIYSLLDSYWLKTPEEHEVLVDHEKIAQKAEKYQEQIEALACSLELGIEGINARELYEAADALREEILLMRRASLQTEAGIYSEGNLVFKDLRNGGFIGQLIDVENEAYDKSFYLGVDLTRAMFRV